MNINEGFVNFQMSLVSGLLGVVVETFGFSSLKFLEAVTPLLLLSY
jgi:hypothetical protein